MSAGRSGAQAGFALVSVLWCVGILALVAGVMVRAAQADGRRSRVAIAQAQAQALADGAVRMALLREAAAPWPPGESDVTFRALDGAAVAVKDLAGLIDINHASAALLTGLLHVAAGLEPAAAARLAAAIVAARGEAAAAPFGAVEDLARVPGLEPAVLSALRPLVTVGSGQAGIDPLSAPPPVLRALPGLGETVVKDWLARRRFPGSAPTLSAVAPDHLARSGGDRVQIIARAEVGGVTAARVAEARLGTEQPYLVSLWRPEAME